MGIPVQPPQVPPRGGGGEVLIPGLGHQDTPRHHNRGQRQPQVTFVQPEGVQPVEEDQGQPQGVLKKEGPSASEAARLLAQSQEKKPSGAPGKRF